MGPTSLRTLLDTGILFEINRRVLHPLGFALSLQWDGDDATGEPDRVVLLKDSDPDGIIFEAKTFEDGMGKFRSYLDRVGGHKMAERNAILGFVEQESALTADAGTN